MGAGGPEPLWGVRGLGCQLRSFPSSGTRGVSGPVLKREAGPGPLARGGKGLTHGFRLLRPLGAVTDNYAGPDLLQ